MRMAPPSRGRGNIMRHRIATKSLGRRAEHRNSMLQNLTVALLKNERIQTTQAKAKVAR